MLEASSWSFDVRLMFCINRGDLILVSAPERIYVNIVTVRTVQATKFVYFSCKEGVVERKMQTKKLFKGNQLGY